MKDNYTDIFDGIDINALTIEDAWNVYEEMPNLEKNEFDSCVEKCFTTDTTNFPVVLNDVFLLLGFSNCKSLIEDFFSEKKFSSEKFDGVHMKLEDVKYHKSKFDSSNKTDKTELFFIYRAFYMLHEFFENNKI